MATSKQQTKDTELEEILQCPICFELPNPPIYQCNRGHHFCVLCYKKLKSTECPMCKSQFYGTRNYLAEELVQKLPCLIISRKSNCPNSTSTIDETLKPSVTIPISGNPPLLCRGNFHCQLRSCKKVLPAGRMLSHIRYSHPTMLSEVSCSGKFKEVWELQYQPSNTYETAIRVSNMGIFFLLVYIGEGGNIDALVQMVASEEVASTFKYKIKLTNLNGQRKISYSNMVLSCLENPVKVRELHSCLILNTAEPSYICQFGDSFQCHLSIESVKVEVKEPSKTPSQSRSAHRRPRRCRAYPTLFND